MATAHPRTNIGLWPGLQRWELPPWMHRMNRLLARLRSPLELRLRFDHRSDMVSVEQVANFETLIHTIVEDAVPGAFVELGCYTGQTTAAIATLMAGLDRTRTLHVYDRFDIELAPVHGVRAAFDRTIARYAIPPPVVHAGDIRDTLPDGLPDRIAFAHIDLGTGGDPHLHAALMHHALNAVYPRLSPGGILVLMDYHVPGVTVGGHDSNPGVRLACDAFFRARPERIRLLYGGPCSHAMVRRASDRPGAAADARRRR